MGDMRLLVCTMYMSVSGGHLFRMSNKQFLKKLIILHCVCLGHPEKGLVVHGPFDRCLGVAVPTPRASGHSVTDIPPKHAASATSRRLAAVENQPKASVHHLSPPDSPSIMKADPCSSTERVTNAILNCHVCCER